MGGDVEEMIDFERVKWRDLWWFFSEQNFRGRCWRNDRFWKGKITWPLIFFRFSSDLILSTRRIFRGAMRQKIAIFKERNSVCRVAKFFQISFYLHKEFSGGRCDRKSRFSKEETAFAGVQKFSDLILSTQRIDAGVQNFQNKRFHQN